MIHESGFSVVLMDEWMNGWMDVGWNGWMADKLSGEQFSSENRDIIVHIGRYGDQTRNDYGPGARRRRSWGTPTLT